MMDCFFVFLFVFVNLINLFFKDGLVFVFFKEVVLDFVIKKDFLDYEIYQNYRFILNLCFVFKVIEKIVVLCFIDYLEDNDLFEIFQLVYKKGYSMEIVFM